MVGDADGDTDDARDTVDVGDVDDVDERATVDSPAEVLALDVGVRRSLELLAAVRGALVAVGRGPLGAVIVVNTMALAAGRTGTGSAIAPSATVVATPPPSSGRQRGPNAASPCRRIGRSTTRYEISATMSVIAMALRRRHDGLSGALATPSATMIGQCHR